ncbi:TolC family protein [Parabacteroides gordonii]|nr:TolC family protein [Parabacteroides gordonii]MCA5584792.1 TolC family protein [Parabacteroides gordonii]RGP14081.1 TolC family protein [Parabacteroides gordonii]
MRYSIRYSLLLLLFILKPVATRSQQAYSLTLDELFRLGTENSLRLQATRMQEVIAADKEKTAQTSRLPDISIGATTGYIGRPTVFRQGLSQPVHPDMPDWSHNYNVEVTQPIYRGGKIHYTIKRSSLEKQIAALNSTNDKAEIKLLLLGQYMDLFSLYKQKEVFARNVEESARRLEDIRRLKKEGIVTRNDELRSELQLTNDQLAYREANDNIAIVSQQLDVVLGLDETLLLQPDTGLLYTAVSLESSDEYVRQAYDNYPELQIARYNTRLAENDIRLSKADYLPSLSLRAANTLARPLSTTMEDMFSNNWNIALSLSYNLSSLYQNKHKVHEARQYVNIRKNREEQVRQDIRVNVKSAWIKHHEALDRVEALLLSVRQAEENYRIVRNRYLNQLSILTDLLDASSIRLEAELQLTNARTEVIYSYYQLMRSCGNL